MTTNLMIVIMGRNSSIYANKENGGHYHGN